MTVFCLVLAWAPAAESVPPNKAMIDALRRFQAAVGQWKGTGTSPTSSGWMEAIECTWGFRESDGRASLNFYFDQSKLFSVALLTYDPDKKLFRLIAKNKEEKTFYFEGQALGEQGLRLERVHRRDEGKSDSEARDSGKKAPDKMDRLDIRLVRGGDKLLFTFGREKTKSYYENHTQIEVFREGPSAEEFAKGPFCVVTGGAGRVSVELEGKTVHVACAACKEELLKHPERYREKLNN